MRLLLVEDDQVLGGAIADHLASEAHAVDRVVSLQDAHAARRAMEYDQILLDLLLPDGSGLDFLIETRCEHDLTPVIILTARDQISERLAGLNGGADDYLVKPFDLQELSARIGAVARRTASTPEPEIVLGAISINLSFREVRLDGRRVELTGREWAVLSRLALRPGATISKPQLEDALYSFGAEIESNAVEVFVSRLRKKLGTRAIFTIRGSGYRLGAE